MKSCFGVVFRTLGPSYGGHGTGFIDLWDHYRISSVMVLLMIAGCIAAIRRRHAAALLLFAFVLTYATYLVLAAGLIFGWYTVPVTAGGVIGAFYGAWALTRRLAPQAWRQRVIAGFAAGYLLCLVVNLPRTVRSDRYVQREIEDGVRRQKSAGLET